MAEIRIRARKPSGEQWERVIPEEELPAYRKRLRPLGWAVSKVEEAPPSRAGGALSTPTSNRVLYIDQHPSFWDSYVAAFGLYPHELRVFSVHRKFVPRAELLNNPDPAAVAHVPAFCARGEVNWADVSQAEIVRRGGNRGALRLKTGQTELEFGMSLEMAVTLTPLLREVVQKKFIGGITPMALQRAGPVTGWGMAVAICALVVFSVTLVLAFSGAAAPVIPPKLQALCWGAAFSYLFRGWWERPRHRAAGEEPFRSWTAGLLCRVAGGVAIVCGLFGTSRILDALAPKSVDFAQRLSLVDGLSWMLKLTGATLLYLGYRFSLPGGENVLKRDRRPPVLFLRSFADDGQNSLNPTGSMAKWLGLVEAKFLRALGPILASLYPLRLLRLLFGRPMDTMEEQLAPVAKKLGPFVAIGEPGEHVITGGAARLYVSHDEWKGRVLELIRDSAAVILQPSGTEGVWWEVMRSFENAGPRRLLICLAHFRDQPGYHRFRERFEKLIGHPLPPAPGEASFMYFEDDWTPHLLKAVMYPALLWPLTGCAVDLPRTLHPYLERVLPEGRARAPKAMRFIPHSPAFAVVVWFLAAIASYVAGDAAFGVAQRSIPARTVEHHGRAKPWQVTLESTWQPEPSQETPAGDFDRFYTKGPALVFGVIVQDRKGGLLAATPESAEEREWFESLAEDMIRNTGGSLALAPRWRRLGGANALYYEILVDGGLAAYALLPHRGNVYIMTVADTAARKRADFEAEVDRILATFKPAAGAES